MILIEYFSDEEGSVDWNKLVGRDRKIGDFLRDSRLFDLTFVSLRLEDRGEHLCEGAFFDLQRGQDSCLDCMDINIHSTRIDIQAQVSACHTADRNDSLVVGVFKDEFVQGDHFLCSLKPAVLAHDYKRPPLVPGLIQERRGTPTSNPLRCSCSVVILCDPRLTLRLCV